MTGVKAPLIVERGRLLAGDVISAARETPGMAQVSSFSAIRRDVARVMASQPVKGDLWFFGYGSLMWNPAIRHEERAVATIRGWHRSFCLWTPLSRGTAERPGLILGLDRGGACRGVAYRIARSRMRTELTALWQREMADRSYIARWVKADAGGHGTISCLTFVMDRKHPRYAGKVPPDDAARVIAQAEGRMGRNADYLAACLASLRSDGIREGTLRDLHRRVRERLRRIDRER